MIRQLFIGAAVLLVVGLLLFVGFKVLLGSGTSDLHAISTLLMAVWR